MEKDEIIKSLTQQIDNLIQQIDTLTRTNAEQADLIRQLQQQIAELSERVGKNSKNSSKPPSSDGYSKPSPKSLRKPSSRKPGGKTGHPGSNLSRRTDATKIVQHMPKKCTGCPHYEECRANASISEVRQVQDAVVEICVTDHQALEIEKCPMHGDCRCGEFPANITATVQYGEHLQALVVALSVKGTVSVSRIHEILSGIFNIPLCQATIVNIVHRCANKVTSTVQEIQRRLTDADIVHVDETGVRIEKSLWWVHVASDSMYTYLEVSHKRGINGIDECGVLPQFKGTAVHDCWSPYWKYDVTHAICCAHLLRELTGISENHTDQKWAPGFINLLLAMKKAKEKATGSGKKELSRYYYNKFDRQYDELIKLGKQENPIPDLNPEKKRGRRKKGKVLALIERLEKYKDSVCLFIHDFAVPFDNNQAERDLRMVKVKTKVAGCFRSENGARDYVKIMSYINTANKHKINAYEAILKAITGTPEFIFE